MAMVEPLPYHREDDGSLRLLKDVASLARAVDDRQRARHDQRLHLAEDAGLRRPGAVFAATTLPCVVLGGVPDPDPAKDLASWGRALTQPTVRGLVVGRALLYPPDGDVCGCGRRGRDGAAGSGTDG